MTIRDRKALKNSAKNALAFCANSPRKLFFLHIAVTSGVTLVIALLSFFLNQGVAATGGLDSINTRTLLQTIEQLLSTASSLALPFWQMGLVFLALQLFRRQAVGPGTLLQGFRKLGPTLRLYILKILIIFATVMGSTWITSMLLSYSPLVNAAYFLIMAQFPDPEAMTTESMIALLEDPAFFEQLLWSLVPMLVIMVIVMFVCLVLILYRIRLADYVVMDHPEKGARHAIKTSWQLTKGNCFQLFLLDLSFWWFYVLEFLLSAVYTYGYFRLVNTDLQALTLVCDLVFCVGQVGLYTWANGYLQTTYAAAYEVLVYQKEQKDLEAQRLAAQTFTPWDRPPQAQ